MLRQNGIRRKPVLWLALSSNPKKIDTPGTAGAYRMFVPEPNKSKEWIMTTAVPAAAEEVRTAIAVEGMLRDIGYVLWLSRKLAAEIRAEKYQPVRPEMAEFCAVDMAACAA
jgi:hypothetical protein